MSAQPKGGCKGLNNLQLPNLFGVILKIREHFKRASFKTMYKLNIKISITIIELKVLLNFLLCAIDNLIKTIKSH